MKKYLVVFASDSRYFGAAKRLRDQATDIGWFDKVLVYGLSDELNDFKPACALNGFVERNPRGFGLWAWKPDFIMFCLQNVIEEGALVVYLDAGVEINGFGKVLFDKYCVLANEGKIVVSRTKKMEIFYNNIELLNFLNIGCAGSLSYQYQATVLLFKNVRVVRDFMTKWKELCLYKNGSYLMNKSCFSCIYGENRHDQSILSLLLKCNQGMVYSMGSDLSGRPKLIETSRYMMTFPFLALRNYDENSHVKYRLLKLPKNTPWTRTEYFFSRLACRIAILRGKFLKMWHRL